MEPDNDLWGCLVHPPQLQRISHMAQEYTNLPHLDIQGEFGGKLGMQHATATGDITRNMRRITMGGDSSRTKTGWR